MKIFNPRHFLRHIAPTVLHDFVQSHPLGAYLSVDWTLPEAKLAHALIDAVENLQVQLLEGICPEAIARLQDKQFTPDVTRVLRNMKAARQVEAVELMVARNTITVAHADALLKATPPEQRTDFKPTERDRQLAPIEQIVKLEKEMSQVQTQYKDAEENYGSDLLNLVVAKGYLTKLLGNDAVKSYITRHESEILEHFELVVNTVSMEEAVQQQLEADGEFDEDPDADSDVPPTTDNTHLDSENGSETPVPGDNAATE